MLSRLIGNMMQTGNGPLMNSRELALTFSKCPNELYRCRTK